MTCNYVFGRFSAFKNCIIDLSLYIGKFIPTITLQAWHSVASLPVYLTAHNCISFLCDTASKGCKLQFIPIRLVFYYFANRNIKWLTGAWLVKQHLILEITSLLMSATLVPVDTAYTSLKFLIQSHICFV